MGRLLTKDELEIVSGGEDEIIVTGTQTGSGDTSSGGTFIGGGAPGSPGDVISIHQDAPPDENEEQMDEIIVEAQQEPEASYPNIQFPPAYDPNNNHELIVPVPEQIKTNDDGSPYEGQEQQLEDYYADRLGGEWIVEYNQNTGDFHVWPALPIIG